MVINRSMKRPVLFACAAAMSLLMAAPLAAQKEDTPTPVPAGEGVFGYSFDCDEFEMVNVAHVQINVEPGEYTIAALGVDGFDPVMALLDTEGNFFCLDDAELETVADLPTASTSESNLNPGIDFTNETDDYATYDILVSGFNGASGEIVLVMFGENVSDEDGLGDPYSIELTPNVVESGVDITTYVIGTEDLDPLIYLVGDEDEPEELDGEQILCDDAGNPDICWGEGGETELGGNFAGDNLDPMLQIPNDLIMVGQGLFLSYYVSSFENETSGDYTFAIHFGIADADGEDIGAFTGDSTAATNGEENNTGGNTGENGETNNNSNGGNGIALESGDTAEAVLSDEGVDLYQFEGEEGQAVTIQMESSSFDTYLGLVDEEGEVVIENDDVEQGDTNSLIEVELPADGTYTIVATAFDIEEVGDGEYELTLELSGSSSNNNGENNTNGNTNGNTGTIEVLDSGPIELGDSVEGMLDAGGENEYTLTLEGGEILTIDVVAATSGFDPNVRVVSPSGTELISDDDGGDGLNSRIANFQVTNEGEYTIIVSSFSGASGGEYVLTVAGRGGNGGSGEDEEEPTPEPTEGGK